jgi:hypothetical protein
VYVHETFSFVFVCFHKSAEDEDGPLDEAAGGSGDEEASKNVNNVIISF